MAQQIKSRRIHEAIDAAKTELEVPGEFSVEVLSEAANATKKWHRPSLDETQIPLVTIDPETSKDLDQAVHIERRGAGYRVWYAIADVPAFVHPGGELDRETRRRGLTYYAPTGKSPLHPPLLSEDVASLMPDEDRPAYLWRMDLDSHGAVDQVEVRRALVRSRAKLSYEWVQREVDMRTCDESLMLLREVGRLRQEIERDRGGVDLQVPAQEIVSDSGYDLRYSAPLPVEGWNAQISLMTGICAADLMLEAGVGILRTMPVPSAEDLGRVRWAARALGLDWPKGVRYGEFLRSLDPHVPKHAAFMNSAAGLLRGAGYTVIQGRPEGDVGHSAVAANYAHVTAPLRRLVDRFGLQLCTSACLGEEPDERVVEALPDLPAQMAGASTRARALDRACVDIVEAVILHDRVGEEFDAVVLDRRGEVGSIQLSEPAVRTRVKGTSEQLPRGEWIKVRLLGTDAETRRVEFQVVPPNG